MFLVLNVIVYLCVTLFVKLIVLFAANHQITLFITFFNVQIYASQVLPFTDVELTTQVYDIDVLFIRPIPWTNKVLWLMGCMLMKICFWFYVLFKKSCPVCGNSLIDTWTKLFRKTIPQILINHLHLWGKEFKCLVFNANRNEKWFEILMIKSSFFLRIHVYIKFVDFNMYSWLIYWWLYVNPANFGNITVL